MQEWVDGVNETLIKEGILLDGTRFENCSAFQHNGLTCILFPFHDVKTDVGKFAVWRLKTNDVFGSTWLSDFVDNRLGGFVGEETSEQRTQQKPSCPLIGQNGNIFHLIGMAARILREHGRSDQAKEMGERITSGAGSYAEALNIIGEYVNITSIDDEGEAEEHEDEITGGMQQ